MSEAPVERPDITTICRENGAFVARVLRRMGVAPSDQDDAWQEVFVVVHQKLADYGICMRTALAFRRKAPARREIPTEELPEVATSKNPEKDLMDRRSLQLFDKAVSTLDDDKRAVFVLYEVEQLSMPEVAEALGCPLQTAYSRHKVAREIVLAAFRRAGEGMAS